ncbi:MAG: HD domain-containing phosphohydrolase [Planctomycetota bacterium]
MAPQNAVKILIVDDEPYIREILSRWLGAEGHECHTAATVDEGWDLLEKNGFSLIVTDIMMPGKSGIQLLTMAREHHSDVPVVMVTGVDDRKTAIRALELGAYGYVIKPFEQNEVVISVVNALERHRLLVSSREYEQRLEEKVREQTEDVRASREEIALRLMAAQEYRHDETGAHIRRIGLYAEALAQQMGRPPEYVELLRLSAPIHDVGKVGVPDAILLKPGSLTDEETKIMKTHTTIGGRILEGSSVPLVIASHDIALWHHEKSDGTGYPQGLTRNDIPEMARIVAILDVYDALVHKRVYREAVPEEKAMALMTEGRSAHFDEDIFDCFLDNLPRIREIRREITG